MVYCIEIDTKMLEKTVLKWGPIGTVLVFENLLVRYPGQKILKTPFFIHIWSHLPGVNGKPLVLFITCTKISQGLWSNQMRNEFWKIQTLIMVGNQ